MSEYRHRRSLPVPIRTRNTSPTLVSPDAQLRNVRFDAWKLARHLLIPVRTIICPIF